MRNLAEWFGTNSLRVAVFSALTVLNAGRVASAQVQPQPAAPCVPVTPAELQNIVTMPAARIVCVAPDDLTRNLSVVAVNGLPPASIMHLSTAQLIALYRRFDGEIADAFWDTLTNEQATALPADIKEIVARARQRRLTYALEHTVDQRVDVFYQGNIYASQGRFMDAVKIFQALYRSHPQFNQLAFNVARSLIEALGAVGVLRPIRGLTLDRTNPDQAGQMDVLRGLFDVHVTREGVFLRFPRNISAMFSGVMQLRPVNVISIAELSDLIDQLIQAKDQLARLLQGPRPIPHLPDSQVPLSENCVAIINFVLPQLQRIRDANTSATPQSGSRPGVATNNSATPPLTPPPSHGGVQTMTARRPTTSPAFVPLLVGTIAAGSTAIGTGIASVFAYSASYDARHACLAESSGSTPDGRIVCPGSHIDSVNSNGELSRTLTLTAAVSGGLTLVLGGATYWFRPTNQAVQVNSVVVQPAAGGAVLTVGGTMR